MITPEKIKNIINIVKKYTKIIKYLIVGGSLPPDILKQYGIPEDYIPFLDYAARYGMLNVKQKNIDSFNPVKLDKILREIKIKSTLNNIVEYSRLNAAGAINTLENTVINRVTAICTVAGLTEREAVRKIVTTGIENKDSRNKIKQALQDATRDYKRDWDRVVSTEIWNAKCLGEAEAILNNETILSNKGGETLVFKRVRGKGCIHCKRLYLEADGVTPKIFKLSDLIANGNNYYLKTADWRPCVGTTHPNCYCVLSVLPEGMKFGQNGILEVVKND